MSLLECVKECFVTNQCEAINYRKLWELCELVTNISQDNIVYARECLYSEILTWPKVKQPGFATIIILYFFFVF